MPRHGDAGVAGSTSRSRNAGSREKNRNYDNELTGQYTSGETIEKTGPFFRTRQPGYPERTRGFPSTPCDGFDIDMYSVVVTYRRHIKKSPLRTLMTFEAGFPVLWIKAAKYPAKGCDNFILRRLQQDSYFYMTKRKQYC
jgi:hypothetical protein